MNTNRQSPVCPVERAGALDGSFRKLMHNPQKILQPYIKAGMIVLDIGCGPGFFTLEIAKMLNSLGKVIAADVQEGMLRIIRGKIKGTALERRIELHKSDYESIGVVEKVDFVLAFWIVHELRNQEKFFEELSSIVKPTGLIFIVEPRVHVSKRDFNAMLNLIKENGFTMVESPKVFFSRTVVLTK